MEARDPLSAHHPLRTFRVKIVMMAVVMRPLFVLQHVEALRAAREGGVTRVHCASSCREAAGQGKGRPGARVAGRSLMSSGEHAAERKPAAGTLTASCRPPRHAAPAAASLPQFSPPACRQAAVGAGTTTHLGGGVPWQWPGSGQGGACWHMLRVPGAGCQGTGAAARGAAGAHQPSTPSASSEAAMKVPLLVRTWSLLCFSPGLRGRG
jgi:hypothetical protein